MFGEIKIIKAPARIELMTYRLVDNALFHCTMLLGNIFGKENIYKTILDVIVFQ